MKLYRYIAFESFVDLVQSQSLCFFYPPVAWDDTYEGFLFRAMKTPLGREKIFGILNSIKQKQVAEIMLSDTILNQARYLCWSRAKDSLALWSIYHYMNKTIMICTTSQKIQLLKYDNRCVSLMKVNYVKSYSLEDEIKTILTDPISTPEIFRTKRVDFKHENEVRAYIGTVRKIEPTSPIRVPVPNISDFIEGVMVHPNAPTWYVRVVEEYCRINSIRFLGQSKLYKFEI